MLTPQDLQPEQATKRYADLTLGDAIGLSTREMTALRQAADALRRDGKLEEALALWGAILTCDPYEARPWKEIAQLQQRLGQHTQAITAYEMLARVADREAEPSYREALSCVAMGDKKTARNLLEHAVMLCSTTAQPWVVHAQRTLEKVR
ncbi:MAG: hypothetical protein KAI47_05020 [Deltaproteobacteria bacterium]|nr:hypothetical protein [Deltaproteobacteria bacterium]